MQKVEYPWLNCMLIFKWKIHSNLQETHLKIIYFCNIISHTYHCFYIESIFERFAPPWIFQNESKPVQMMHQKAYFGLAFIPEVNCQILEMPYIGKELSMLIILPKEIEDDSTGLERVSMFLINHKKKRFKFNVLICRKPQRQEIKLISHNANISLLSMLQPCIMPTVRQIICVTTGQIV